MSQSYPSGTINFDVKNITWNTRVVNVRKEACTVYVGRHTRDYAGSIFGNPFKVGVDGTLDEVIAKYRAYVLERPCLLAMLPSLAGQALGCWCHPKPCHAGVLVDLIANPPAPLPPGLHRFEVRNWHPANLNSLTKGKRKDGIRLKNSDRDMIAHYARHVPRATGRRRLDMLLTFGPGNRSADPDAYFKSTLDALKLCGAIVGDSSKWISFTEPRFVRTVENATVITLTDI